MCETIDPALCMCLPRTERFFSLRSCLLSLCPQALEYSHVCKYACSEEVPELQDMGGPVDGTAILLLTVHDQSFQHL